MNQGAVSRRILIDFLFLFSQNSDTESCDMLNHNRRMHNKHHLVMRTDSGDMSAGDAEEREGAVGGGGGGFNGPRRHLQSVDSNHMESQSEWSDDELGRDGEEETLNPPE